MPATRANGWKKVHRREGMGQFEPVRISTGEGPNPDRQREGAMRLAPKRCCSAEAREPQRGGQSQEVAHKAFPRVAPRYRYPEEGRMALIIKDIAIVAGLGLLYLMMVIVMIVIAIFARE